MANYTETQFKFLLNKILPSYITTYVKRVTEMEPNFWTSLQSTTKNVLIITDSMKPGYVLFYIDRKNYMLHVYTSNGTRMPDDVINFLTHTFLIQGRHVKVKQHSMNAPNGKYAPFIVFIADSVSHGDTEIKKKVNIDDIIEHYDNILQGKSTKGLSKVGHEGRGRGLSEDKGRGRGLSQDSRDGRSRGGHRSRSRDHKGH